MPSNDEFVSIMEIDFLNKTKENFLKENIMPALRAEEKRFIVTANPEIVMKAREDERYKQMVQSADYVVPDGAGILLAAKHLKQPMRERVSGYDLMIDLLEIADKNKFRCYFLGAEEKINHKAVHEVRSKYPNVVVAGSHHGFFDLHDKDVAQLVRDTRPDIVFVALGLPRQEEWIYEHYGTFAKGIFMGVGGSFDVLAGEVKRAPEIWIKLNLEWLYRIVKQPSRVKRIFKVFEFIIRIFTGRT